MSTPVTRPAQRHQERELLAYDHGSEAATATVKVWGSKTRAFRVDRVWYNNPTGFAASATDYWTITIQDGATVLASWSTHSTAEGALTADTPVDLVVAATTDVAAGNTLSVVFTKTGAPAALPAGRVVIEGTRL